MAGAEHVLITIRISHFCEKARWALRYTGTPYREEAHAPGFHVPAVRRARGHRATPVLVTPTGVLTDSTDILRALDGAAPAARKLYPAPFADEVLALEERFDQDLGPHVRRYLYFHLLPERSLALRVLRAGVPAWERTLLPLFFPAIRALMARSMRIDAQGAERSRAKVEAVFSEVTARLAEGRRYLVGERFTAADLTFAALAAPIVAPPNYGAELPGDGELPRGLLTLLAPWRASPAAEFVRRLYRDHRDLTPG